ncbi:hypothetical protein CSKR_103521 [Clonorchis sinensis]|uniref:Uncharacterized protein n=1 Tax=Clonorchis sinensis TaxID=79923 RepID=A0A419PJ31_CLOSI|nr:hypothetical protein CSKR_103521 [Clonorchis sinensis]
MQSTLPIQRNLWTVISRRQNTAFQLWDSEEQQVDGLLMGLLKILRQPTTGFALLGAHQLYPTACHKKSSAVASFWRLAVMQPEGSTKARTLPGCPSLDSGIREAEVAFEPDPCPCAALLMKHWLCAVT